MSKARYIIKSHTYIDTSYIHQTYIYTYMHTFIHVHTYFTGSAGYFLSEDLTVPCYDISHILWMLTLGSTCLTLYAIGIPSMAFFFLSTCYTITTTTTIATTTTTLTTTSTTIIVLLLLLLLLVLLIL